MNLLRLLTNRKHYFTPLLFILLSLTTAAAQANFGVAFVHGTGNQNNAESDYWTREFTSSVMQGSDTPSRYVVVNCDFEQYLWDSRATGCLADQLTQFIQNQNISQLYIITHSHGGNMIRWILSNPTYDSRFPGIINAISIVTALAPSSAGTPLADAVIDGNLFETTLGWILGYGNNAVRQQQESWMAFYNANYLLGTSGRPNLPKPFKTVVGTDVESAIWDGDSYCGGYQNQVALEFTQNWLNRCSDGFLECSSQEAAGSVWFRDTQRTRGREPLSHQQSRRKCFNLDVQLRNDL